VAAERDDPGSVLYLYRRLLTARRASPALQLGAQELLDAPTGGLAWRRTSGPDERIVVMNLSDEALLFPCRGTVEVSSDGHGEGEPFTGSVAPDTALLLVP
jgi:alpha-glucosidase